MSVCKNCGATVQAGFSFCPTCGQDVSTYENAIICLSCNTPNPAGTRFCKGCGAVLIKRVKTVKCIVCGSDNAEDANFCTVCGSAIPGEKKIEFESESILKLKELIPAIRAYSEANGLFSGASNEEIAEMTYICPICGKANSIDDEKCKRCGRDRKRSALLAVKNRIPTFEEAISVPDKLYKPLKPEKTEIEYKNNKSEYIYGKKTADTAPYYNQCGTVNGNFEQMSPIVQPLAIVPYVTQEQPLWQIASHEENSSADNTDCKSHI